jgi:DNA-binding transcriptional LysR family regulator
MSIDLTSEREPDSTSHIQPAIIPNADRVSWNDLRIMLIVVEAGSIRSGTTNAGVSLNTARKAIERLEHAYREPLLIRSVTGIALTKRGQTIALAAHAMRDVLKGTL